MQARHPIEHIETIPEDLVAMFGRSGVVAIMQPNHCTRFVRADGSDDWSSLVGAQRAGRAFRTRDIRDAGALLAPGSDWPVAPFDPRAILADAQLRRRSGCGDQAPVCPNQSLTALMALEGYTTHAAIAEGKAESAGMIAPGCRADFTAFAVDAPDELADAPIVAHGGGRNSDPHRRQPLTAGTRHDHSRCLSHQPARQGGAQLGRHVGAIHRPGSRGLRPRPRCATGRGRGPCRAMTAIAESLAPPPQWDVEIQDAE